MHPAALAWLILRALRWALLLFFLAFALQFIAYREAYLDQFGRLMLDVPSLQTLYWITLLLAALATAMTYGIRLTRDR